ncbi:hypothetical protein [Clostridium sp. UBA6640]|uniref:hypothetical protein n=1 Tax=Clostridium sp. UBA6640 TaxID=1946370 RepID=UPI0025BB57A2|nr:hypothetical protein [Clostridium sp. UBA6640]
MLKLSKITDLSYIFYDNKIMKKKIGLIVDLIMATILLSVKVYPVVFYVSMEDTLGIKFSEVNKIELFSGSTGKSAEVLEKNEIDEVLSKYKNTKVKKKFDQRLREGSSLSITLYKND